MTDRSHRSRTQSRRTRPIATRLIATAAAALLGGPLLGVAPSTAATATETGANSSADSGATPVSSPAPMSAEVDTAQEATRQVRAYWTPERMAAAKPADGPATTAATDRPTDADRDGPAGPRAARTVEPMPPANPPSVDKPASPAQGQDGELPAAPAVGKVFFHDPATDADYECSASVVAGESKNLLATAAHCVHGGKDGQWAQNWMFVPYFDHDERAFGTWAGAQLTVAKGWLQTGSYDWDVAFVNLWPSDGKQVADVVGGNGLTFDNAKDLPVTALGYPALDPYDGQWQVFCQNPLYPHGEQQVGFDCLLTGGSSGGPFLHEYAADSRLGYVNGVVSNGPDTTSYSPYFDTDVANLYDAVQDYRPGG